MNKIKLSFFAIPFLVGNLLAQDSERLNDITVLSSKVEEKIIDLASSISVLDEASLEDNEIKSFRDLSTFTPSLYIFDGNGAGNYAPSFRGLSGDSSIDASSVGVYVDGIPYLSNTSNDLIFENIERIEVLRGPQSTIYGKNSYSGVINVTTKEPSNEVEGKISATLGSDDKKELSFFVNTPLIKDKLFLGLTSKFDKKDGYIKNVHLNKDANAYEDKYLKAYLKATPSDNLKVSLILSKLKKEGGASSLNFTHVPDVKEFSSNIDGKRDLDNKDASLKFEYSFDDIKLTSLTTYRNTSEYSLSDGFFSTVNLYTTEAFIDKKELSQEFRFLKKTDKFDYLLGVYADKLEDTRKNIVDGSSVGDYKTESKTKSIFTNLKYNFTDKLSASVGVRFAKDDIKIDDKLFIADTTNSYEVLSPKFNLMYKFNEDFSTYFTVSKGYKSGGYFPFSPSLDTKWFSKESLTNYEVGFKSYLFDSLHLNASAYYMDIKNKQVLYMVSPPTLAYIQNAAKSESKGIELELNQRINKDISLFGTFSYNDTSFKDFKDNAGDYKGNQNPFSPKYIYSLGANYRDDLGIFANINYRVADEMYSDKENFVKNDKLSTINAKIGYEKENFEIYLYGNNLANKSNITSYLGYASVGTPREIGIKLNYRF